MRFVLFIFSIAILAAGCKSGNSGKPEKIADPGNQPLPYFSFNELTCYQSGYENTIADTLIANEHRSPADSIKKTILLDKTPLSLSDTSFIAQLETMGFRKKQIDTAAYREIAFIFSQKPNLGSVKANCPVVLYQHLLIFKKGGRITGMAKINFRCTQQQISGTKANTDNFGQNGDYERLEELLGE